MSRAKLILFDIDETMITSDGAGRRAIMRALKEVFALAEETTNVAMSGKTDPQIVHEVLSYLGFQPTEIDEGMQRAFAIYPPILKEEIEKSAKYAVHEGVRELLLALTRQPQACLGLLTGNIEAGARLKLEPFALNQYFPMGAYGSDSANRLELPEVARVRGEAHFKQMFSPTDLVIIGDSVMDVRCAKEFGAVSLAVNTGKTTRAELESAAPDYLFATLADTGAVLAAIMSP